MTSIIVLGKSIERCIKLYVYLLVSKLIYKNLKSTVFWWYVVFQYHHADEKVVLMLMKKVVLYEKYNIVLMRKAVLMLSTALNYFIFSFPIYRGFTLLIQEKKTLIFWLLYFLKDFSPTFGS
jgi:hypothetical protein